MQRYASVGWLLAAAVVLGCSGKVDGPKTVKAGGKVTLDGAPVEGAVVTFSPQAQGPSAIGKSDAQGQFTLLTTNSVGGVVAGDYKVGIAKVKEINPLTPEQAKAYVDKGQTPPTPKTTDELPVKYKDPATSGLTAKVTADGKNDFPFDLKK